MKNVLCTYHYDPLDRLNGTTPALQSGSLRFYCQSRIATEIQGSTHYSIMQHGDQLLAQQTHRADQHTSTLLATDLQRSVLQTISAAEQQTIAYTPFGHHANKHTNTHLLGFNGERTDPVTGHYLLGNGYRAFNPVLMRFNSPDTLSPFDKGGINSYSYCQSNPIKFRDPSGHFVTSLRGLFAVEGITSSLGGIALALSSPARTSGPAIATYALGTLGLLYGGLATRVPGTLAGSLLAGSSSALGAASMAMGARTTRLGSSQLFRRGSLTSMEEALEESARFRPNRHREPPPDYIDPLPGFRSPSQPDSQPQPPSYVQLFPERQSDSRGEVPGYTPISQAHEPTTLEKTTVKISKLPEIHRKTSVASKSTSIRDTKL